MKPDKLFCFIFWFAFLALTVHKIQYILKCFDAAELAIETLLCFGFEYFKVS